MRIRLIGTGAISHEHAQAYQNIGFRVTVCTNRSEESGRRFASQYGAQFVPTYEEVCRHPEVDIVDVCTYPDFRQPAVQICAEAGKHIQVEKPIATTVQDAREDHPHRCRCGHFAQRHQPEALRRYQHLP